MISYLTSNIGGSYQEGNKRIATCLNSENSFIENLKMKWKENACILIIAADPGMFELNDSIRNIFERSFPMSGLGIEKIETLDHRNLWLADKLKEYDVIILSGGHVPTQNLFFQTIKLKEKILEFQGILIGISAGTMNAAESVYAQPELEGESVDQNYQRFLPGLGITKYMILPHYQDVQSDILDGKAVMEDITYPDSFGREFYALVDGSYMIVEGQTATLLGEAYLVKDGNVTQICKKDKSITIGS